MHEPGRVLKEVLFKTLPPVWPDGSLREQILRQAAQDRRCVVALDDDPTGTQTMHGIWVLTSWEIPELRAALADDEPALYVLTNSRSMPLAEARALNRQVVRNLVVASRAEGRTITLVSRSDSTLRGHYPGEVDALADALALASGTPIDGICLIPFFLEGGRFTIGNVHWVQEGEYLVPAAQTPYARDSVFGYHHSFMPEWVEERSAGRISASDVLSISLETIRLGGPDKVAELLRTAGNRRVVIVNAADYRDLEVFVRAVMSVDQEGKRFLFRSAASLVKVAAGMPDFPLVSPGNLVGDRPATGGLVVFGSHVPKSTAQLHAAQRVPSVTSVELPIRQVLDTSTRDAAIAAVSRVLDTTLAAGRDALVFTTRELVIGRGRGGTLKTGKVVSSALAEVVRRLNCEPRYVIAKGGITASDLATDGLNVSAARVNGQISPGVPVWTLGPGSRWPGMPYIVFPGNVGEDDTVADLVRLLRAQYAWP